MIDTRLDMRESHEARLAKRDAIEQLHLISSYLPELDSGLLHFRYAKGWTYKEIAEYYGHKAEWARKKVVKYERRMKHPGFRIVLTKSHLIPEDFREMAEEVFVNDSSMDTISENLLIPFHKVRVMRKCLDAIIDTILLTEQQGKHGK